MQEIDLLILAGFDQIAIYVIASILLILLGFGLGYYFSIRTIKRQVKVLQN